MIMIHGIATKKVGMYCMRDYRPFSEDLDLLLGRLTTTSGALAVLACFFRLTVLRLDFTSTGTLAAGAMSMRLGSYFIVQSTTYMVHEHSSWYYDSYWFASN